MKKKTLRICLSKELPDVLERDVEYLYLLYDKLLLFFGQNLYYDPFVICERIPDDPISGCLYIEFTGSVKSYIGDAVIEIADIEDSKQAEKLKDLGTTFFIKSDNRYLDIQHRTLQLPYHNGTYSMTVSLAKDLKINDKTVVRYDAESERFYIDGEYDNIPNFKEYTGKGNKSVYLEVNNHCIHASVRLSPNSKNILRIVNGGLYANIDDKVSSKDFKDLKDKFVQYKENTSKILEAIDTELAEKSELLLKEETILKLVHDAVSSYYPGIDELISFYEDISLKLEDFEEKSKRYTDKVFEEKAKMLEKQITDSVTDVWGDF